MTYSERLVAIIEVFEAEMMTKMDAHQAKIEANSEELMSAMKSQSRKHGSLDGCQSRDDGSLPRKD
jgi:hypothetical protein